MALSEYTGLTPKGYSEETVVGRVARHHRWDVTMESRDDCIYCGTELSLRERHLLVTLSTPTTLDGDRHHLCNESCLREWLAD